MLVKKQIYILKEYIPRTYSYYDFIRINHQEKLRFVLEPQPLK